MITKRKGHGQTECKRCKDNGRWSLTWDSFLYNFNDEPYCFECLMEMLEESQQKLDDITKYIEENKNKIYAPYGDNEDTDYEVCLDEDDITKILNKLKGSDGK